MEKAENEKSKETINRRVRGELVEIFNSLRRCLLPGMPLNVTITLIKYKNRRLASLSRGFQFWNPLEREAGHVCVKNDS